MLNIIKSQLYGVRCNIMTYIGLCSAIIMLIVGIITNLDMIGSENPTGSLIFAISGEFNSIISFMVISIVASCVCGWDFDDKTVNYEILYGHSRSQVFWARTFTSVIIGTVSAMILMIIPTLVFTVMNGWGYAVSAKEAVIRLLLMIFSMIRTSSVAVFLTFLVKKSWGAGMLCAVILYVEAFISMFEYFDTKYLLLPNMIEIMSFSNMSYGFANGEDVTVFKDTLGGQFVALTIIISVVATAVTLFGGYAIFRKRNLQ